MTLDEAKKLLSANNISFMLHEFKNESEYWNHVMLFPYTQNAKSCKVITIIICSKNGKKNIELQFNQINDVFQFEELRFGSYNYEMFDYKEDMLANDLLDRINQIMSGNLTIIVSNNLNKKTWTWDACFDHNDDDPVFGYSGLHNTLLKIEKKKGFLSKMFNAKTQYEIYDWNTYRCVIK